MRSLIISIAIIALALITTAANSLWTCMTIDGMISDIESLDIDAVSIDSITDDWADAEKIFAVTAQRTYLRDIDETLRKLKTAIELKDDLEFATSKNSLIYNMKELRNSQSFDLKTVL